MIRGRVSLVSDSFRSFERQLDRAIENALDEAAEVGVREAKQEMTRVLTGRSRASIRANKARRGVGFTARFVGRINEFGTKERAGPRGRVTPLPHLRPGMLAGAARILPAVRSRMSRTGLIR